MKTFSSKRRLELKTKEGYSAEIYITMSAQYLTRDSCFVRDICLFQGGQTHIQSELLQETVAKKGCGRRGGAGGGNSPALATPDHCLAS